MLLGALNFLRNLGDLAAYLTRVECECLLKEVRIEGCMHSLLLEIPILTVD